MSIFGIRRYVVVADDNQDAARGLAFLLRFAGFDVQVFHDGRDAVAGVAARMPDIVLLDIGLPGLNGFEVAERIRLTQGTKSVLIIAISGYDPDMVRANPLRVLFDHHFVKPVDFNTILSLLNRAS
jgi:CheY-like chemotaxis protein